MGLFSNLAGYGKGSGAGPGVRLEIVGDRELVRKLLTLGSKRRIKAVCGRALGAGAKITRDAAKQLIAARTKRRTGKLRKGVEITRIGTTKRGWTRRVQLKRRDFFGIAPDDPYYYPAIVEYGRDEAEPRRFMKDAYESTKAATATAIEAELAAGIEREAAKG